MKDQDQLMSLLQRVKKEFYDTRGLRNQLGKDSSKEEILAESLKRYLLLRKDTFLPIARYMVGCFQESKTDRGNSFSLEKSRLGTQPTYSF